MIVQSVYPNIKLLFVSSVYFCEYTCFKVWNTLEAKLVKSEIDFQMNSVILNDDNKINT